MIPIVPVLLLLLALALASFGQLFWGVIALVFACLWVFSDKPGIK